MRSCRFGLLTRIGRKGGFAAHDQTFQSFSVSKSSKPCNLQEENQLQLQRAEAPPPHADIPSAGLLTTEFRRDNIPPLRPRCSPAAKFLLPGANPLRKSFAGASWWLRS